MKTLQQGDSYQYMKYCMAVTNREGNIVFAENSRYGFEVFKIRNRKVNKLPGGGFSKPGEYPPSTSEWGVNSAHFPPRHSALAEKFFRQLIAKGEKREHTEVIIREG